MVEQSTSDDGFVTVRALFTGGGVVLLGLVLELGISFVGKLLIAQSLGKFDYGAVSLGIITAAIGSTLALVGLDRGIGRYLPRKENSLERRGVLMSSFRISIPIALLVGGGLFIAAPVLSTILGDPSVEPVLRVFAVAIPLGAVMKLAVGTAQGRQETVPKVLIEHITFPATRLLGIVVALLLGAGALGISYAYLASYGVAALGGVYYLVAKTDLLTLSQPYTNHDRELLSFSLPLLVTSAMTIVFADIDMYMLGYFRGTGPVGEYNVAYPLGQLLTTALSAFGFLFMPVVSELDAAGENDQLERLFQVVTKWVVMATLPVFLVLVAFPDRVIRLTFGAEYAGAAAALSVLSVGFFLHTSFGLNKGALTSLGHTRLVMYDDTVAAAVNVLLNLVLIPRFGLLGAAYATTASYAVMNGLYSIQLYRRTGVQPFTTALLRPLLVGLVAMGTIYAFARQFLVITPLSLVGLFAAFGAVYAVGILRFGIEPEEVRLVLSIEERFGVDLGPLKEIAKRFM